MKYKIAQTGGVIREAEFTVGHYMAATGISNPPLSPAELNAAIPDMPPSLALQMVNRWNRGEAKSGRGIIYYLDAEDAGV